MTGADIGLVEARSVTSASLNKAFATALLLTASVKRSESAVLEGVECLGLEENFSEEMLLREVLKSALDRGSTIAQQGSGEFDRALSLLPAELRRVMRLPTHLRYCFTLRMLVGLPLDLCARLLRLEIVQIEEAVIDAAQILAEIQR